MDIANSTAAVQNISSEDFISDDVRQRLENFTESGIADINITQYQIQIDTWINTSALLEQQLMAFQNLEDVFNAAVSNNYQSTHF